MLVLSRKAGQMIVIGEGVVVRVVSIQGGTIRLGIEAPREVPVHREEVVRRREAYDSTPLSVDNPVPPIQLEDVPC